MDTNRERLIFFSVPYESGWSATVNGQSVPIERVNVGFMAVTVPQGENVTVEFTYHTPGLSLGFIITLISLALLVAYLMLMNRVRPKPAPHRGPSLLRVGRFSHYAKTRHASFRRPGAMTLYVHREAAVPEEETPIENTPPSDESTPPPNEEPQELSQQEEENSPLETKEN